MDLSRHIQTTQSSVAKYDLRGEPVNRTHFESKFSKTDSCWNWGRGTNNTGYGTYGMRLAHRVAHELYIGPIPDGANVCHSCDNRLCVNPKHLWLGSRKDNMQDCKAKGRMSEPPRFVGSGHPQSKLTEELVIALRNEISQGALKRPTARKYGIDRATMRSILERKTWRHV